MPDNLALSSVTAVKKKSVVGAVSYFFRTLLLQGIGLVSTLVLSAYLSPADFGVYGVVTIIIGILVFFSDIGLAAALVQKKDDPSTTEYRTAFTVQLGLSFLILSVVVGLMYSGWITMLAGEDANWILLALGVSFPLATLKTIPSIILERQLLFSKLVLPQIVEQLVFHGILIALAVSGMGVGMYAYAVLARSVAGVVAMVILQRWNFGFSLNSHALRTLLRFGVQFQANDLLARIKDQLYYLLLARWLPLDQFGYIQWSKNWSMYPYNLTVQNILAITFPTFSRLQHDSKALGRAIEKSLFFITLAIFPILAGMSIFIIPFISVFPVYEKWLPAVASLILFNASIAWSAISTPLTNTLNATGKIHWTLRLMIMWTSMTWLLTPPAIWLFGYQGVAAAAFVISCTSFIPVLLVKKIVAINVWDQLWRQLIATVGMLVVGIVGVQYWGESSQHLLMGMCLVGGSYVVTLLVVGRKKLQYELGTIRSAFKK